VVLRLQKGGGQQSHTAREETLTERTARRKALWHLRRTNRGVQPVGPTIRLGAMARAWYIQEKSR
jgi:hypothetical protein